MSALQALLWVVSAAAGVRAAEDASGSAAPRHIIFFLVDVRHVFQRPLLGLRSRHVNGRGVLRRTTGSLMLATRRRCTLART
eukprot:COSAG02_NODE_93_length_37477_cov_78.101129_20_plen_82_part_00